MDKKIIIFDLDNTLNPPKCKIRKEMADLLERLLEQQLVAIISGSALPRFEVQVVSKLHPPKELLKKLILLPTSGTQMFRYVNGKWKRLYKYHLNKEEKEKIFTAFKKALPEAGYIKPETSRGKIIEDRDSQITFSAYGQKASIYQKVQWDPDRKKRKVIVKHLKKYIPELQIGIGGSTSIDVTRMGMDKAFGIEQLVKRLKIKKKDMLFIGDALFKGGNDYPVKRTGIKTIAVKDEQDTKKIIRKIIS
tara:strand:+ start:783 stop:1529 length:747 start_codon:yes stop_codon:yes gene_type:complete